jgi:hypothetical protein
MNTARPNTREVLLEGVFALILLRSGLYELVHMGILLFVEQLPMVIYLFLLLDRLEATRPILRT